MNITSHHMAWAERLLRMAPDPKKYTQKSAEKTTGMSYQQRRVMIMAWRVHRQRGSFPSSRAGSSLVVTPSSWPPR